MQQIDWYFDFISPFAYLQCERLEIFPDSVQIYCHPVLLAGLLSHWGSKGPAEIPPKRVFTYRHAYWLAKRQGIPFRMPPAHPFNPLKALRLAIAMNSQLGTVREIFRFIWRDGNTTDDPQAWADLLTRLGAEQERLVAAEVKNALRSNTEAAAANGVFGVPTLSIDGELFWGFDATSMALDYLTDPMLFQDAEMQRISHLSLAASRI